ncbi:MAG: polysaccharide deacetylase family protein [Niastella sp.]|nr:polysaccharide deacetylase family protein [Niastella sp.]
METPLYCYIAWTIDDGPSEFTGQLIDSLNDLGAGAVTWFCARSNMHRYKDSVFQGMKQSGEIGIHEIHPQEPWCNWFPHATRPHFPSIEQAVAELEQYLEELSADDVQPAFVRLPGGEFSELLAYIKYYGATQDAPTIARCIIDNKPVPHRWQFIADGWQYLQTQLRRLGLTIWSGAPGNLPLLGGSPFHYNSWQAESAGVAQGRGANNVTWHEAPARKLANIKEVNKGLFERACQHILQTGESFSLVVLTHDVYQEDVDEIAAHIVAMNRYIEQHGLPIGIRYVTLSALFKLMRC